MNTRAIPIAVAAWILAACTTAEPLDTSGEAPFVGPYSKVESEADRNPARIPGTETAPGPAFPDLLETAGLPAKPSVPYDPAARRRRAWLTEPFRCKAISSTRLRRCAFEKHEGGYRLRFQSSDVVCQDVEFDEGGDPSALLGCAGAWLRIPKRNRLRKARGRAVWSGSHRGWKWRDGEDYCCPGLWLEAPSSLAPQSRTSP